jgi:hypothetical protein
MAKDQTIGVDASGQERPMRVCTPEHNGMQIGCGQTDDHPRHVIENPGGEDISVHIDCHAAAGCISCKAQAEGAKGKTGADMLAHITGGN